MGLQAWGGGLVPSASQIFCLEEDRGRTGWAVQSLTTLHGAVLAAGQQGRGEAGGHGLSTNSPSPTPTATQTRPRRGGRMWVRRCGCGHGHGPGHGQGCGLSGLRRAPGVEPTDTGRWGPGAHSDSESGGRNMISKAIIAHADRKPHVQYNLRWQWPNAQILLRALRCRWLLATCLCCARVGTDTLADDGTLDAEPHLAHGPR